MLGAALNKATELLGQLNLFNKIYALADRVSDGNKSYPAFFNGAGNYEPIKYDTTNGMCYFRKTGKVNLSQETSTSAQTTSCADVLYKLSYPLRLVVLLPKEKADCDGPFADDFFAEVIISKLTSKTFGNETVRSAKFVSTGYESDNQNVLKEEYSNWKEINDINYLWSYLAIDFNFEVIVDKDCLSSCVTEVSDFTLPSTKNFCQAVEDCGVIQSILTALASFTGLIIGETPSGIIDGVNTVFTTANAYQSGMLSVYKNGQRLILGADYSETTPGSATYTYSTAPLAGDVLRNDYIKA